jgi:hypothetical protein
MMRDAKFGDQPAQERAGVVALHTKENSRRAVSRGGCSLELYPGGADFSNSAPGNSFIDSPPLVAPA